MRVKDAVGAFGEEVAARHLRAAGMVVLARNWRSPRGELDIIARDGPALVFCEVKTRRGVSFGRPAEAVVPAKLTRIRALALEWLAASGLHPRQLRFDVVEVLAPPGGKVRVAHLRGVE